MLQLHTAITITLLLLLAALLDALACTLLLIPVAGMGLLYTGVAVVAGAWFVAEAHGLYARAIRGEREVRAMRVFHASNTYLTLIFLAVGVDPLLPF